MILLGGKVVSRRGQLLWFFLYLVPMGLRRPFTKSLLKLSSRLHNHTYGAYFSSLALAQKKRANSLMLELLVMVTTSEAVKQGISSSGNLPVNDHSARPYNTNMVYIINPFPKLMCPTHEGILKTKRMYLRMQ